MSHFRDGGHQKGAIHLGGEGGSGAGQVVKFRGTDA